MKFGIGVIYKISYKKREFHESLQKGANELLLLVYVIRDRLGRNSLYRVATERSCIDGHI